MWVGLLTSMYSMYFTVLCNKKLMRIKDAEKKTKQNKMKVNLKKTKNTGYEIQRVILEKKCRDYSLSAAYSILRAFVHSRC